MYFALMYFARFVLAVAVLLCVWGCRQRAPVGPPPTPTPVTGPAAGMSFEATAYSIEGKTASGGTAREGIVAADPKVLPFGTRIRVKGAGNHDGEYVVTDTGRAIKGREIDIYMASDREAKQFGRKKVTVEIVERGDGNRSQAR